MLQRLTEWPMTQKLMTATFLWSSGIMVRMAQGGARMVAAYPAINTKPGLTEKDKDSLFVERIFTEVVGQVLLTYGLLHVAQDIGAKVVEKIDPRFMGPDTPSLAPKALINLVKGKLTQPEDLAVFQKAVQDTFDNVSRHPVVKKPFDLNSTHNTIYNRLYGEASLKGLANNLKRPEWLNVEACGKVTGLLEQEASHYFKNLNGLTNGVILPATVLTAILSGGPLQDWNDHWLREKVVPKMLSRLDAKKHETTTVAEKPAHSGLFHSSKGVTQPATMPYPASHPVGLSTVQPSLRPLMTPQPPVESYPNPTGEPSPVASPGSGVLSNLSSPVAGRTPAASPVPWPNRTPVVPLRPAAMLV